MEKIKYILLTILLLFTIDVSASSISPFSIKNNNSNGYYDIKKYQQSDMTTIDTYGQIGSSYNVSYIQTLLNFNSNISSSSYYDLKINFINSNFNTSSIQDVKIVGYNTIPTTLTYNENLGTTLDLVYLKNNTSNTNTNSITIRFYNKLLTNYSYFQIFILQDYRVMNTGISSIDLTRVDDNQAIKDLQENQNTNRDLIINNITNSIDNSLNNCRDSYNLFNPYGGNLINGKGISSNGSIIDDSTGSYYDYYIPVKASTTYNLSNKDDVQFAGSWFFAFYDNNKNFISLNRLGENSTNFTFTTTSNVSYIRLYSYLNLANVNSLNNIMLSKGSSKIKFENYGKVCISKLDDTNDKLNDLNSNITSPNVPDKNDLSTKLDTTGWLKPGPVDSIINMPLNLINNLLSSLNNNTCSQLIIDIPYLKNKQLIIPCISTLYEKMGLSSLFNSIGAVASAFILFRYLVGFYKWVDDTLSFREQNWGDF